MCLYQLIYYWLIQEEEDTGSYRRRRDTVSYRREEDTGSYRRRRILAHTGGGGYWLKYEPLDILGLVCVPQLVYQ